MKMKLVAVTVLSLLTTAPFAQDVTSLNSEKDKISYSIGVDFGTTVRTKGLDLSVAAMAQGITDGMRGDGKLLLTPEEMKAVLERFQKSMMAKATAQFEAQAKDNQAKGQAFLEENKNKPGVITLPSGLQYKIIKQGKGKKPKLKDTVTVNYTGSLINGSVFDSTDKSNEPATFQLSAVIPGWTEALQLMPEGSTWEIYVPAKLAYGARSVGNLIGPNETLIFKVELVKIAKSEKK